MTKQELTEAFELAQTPSEECDWSALSIFEGFGLPDFKPVHCTKWAVSRLIRYQCLYIGGGWDYKALNDLADAGRRNFNIMG